MRKFITFGLGRERFGISIEVIKEIIANYKIVPLPKAHEFVYGIITLRGSTIPVVDMRQRFDMPSRDKDDETRIIVLDMADFTVGVQVDKVYDVLKIDETAIEVPPRFADKLKADYLGGVAEVNGKLTIILDLDEIFSTSETIIMKEKIKEAESMN